VEEVIEESNVAVGGAATTDIAFESAVDDRRTTAVKIFNVLSIVLSVEDIEEEDDDDDDDDNDDDDVPLFVELVLSMIVESSWYLLSTLLIAVKNVVADEAVKGATPDVFLSTPPMASTAPDKTFTGRFSVRISAIASRAVDADFCVN
jgi:hypothetical protein